MSIGDRLGWFAVILIGALVALLGWPFLVFVIVLGGAALWVTPKIDHRASGRRYRASEARRLLSDCDRQHRELMEGGSIVIPGPRLNDGDTLAEVYPRWMMSTGNFRLPEEDLQ